jgi:hypothetical protein
VVALIRLLSFSKGGPGYTLYTAYSGAVLVAGGSGISYVMSVLDDMLRKHESGMSHLRVIEVIWSVMDPGEGANQAYSHSVPDPPMLMGATYQIRSTLCSPSLPRSCSRALHRIPRSHSGSMYTGPGSQLVHHVCRARRFHRESTFAQDVLTSLTRYRA